MNARLYGTLLSAGASMMLVAYAASPEPQTNSAAAVVGNWRLVAVDTVLPDGSVSDAWMGKQPTGLIVYQPDGVMAVQIMRDPKPAVAGGSHFKATPEELKGAYFGYYAYWGTYTVAPGDKTISHQLKASLWPEEVGITYKRSYVVDGERLVLTTPPYMYEGRELTNRLTWERWKD